MALAYFLHWHDIFYLSNIRIRENEWSHSDAKLAWMYNLDSVENFEFCSWILISPSGPGERQCVKNHD